MYAIIDKRTGKYLYGTDHRFSPPRQRTSEHRLKVYETQEEAALDLKLRKCGPAYAVMKISVQITPD